MTKWAACLVGIILTLSIVNPIFAQEVFQPYENPRSSASYGPRGEGYRSFNNPLGSAFGPGIQIQQGYSKPWFSNPYAGEERYQPSTNPWGRTTVTPFPR